jgi:hypothetical protein
MSDESFGGPVDRDVGREVVERAWLETTDNFLMSKAAAIAFAERLIPSIVAVERERWQSLVTDYSAACGELSKGLPRTDPMWDQLLALEKRAMTSNAVFSGAGENERDGGAK